MEKDEYNNNYQTTKETHGDGSIITYEYKATDALFTSISRDSRGKATRFEFDQTKNGYSTTNSSGFIHNYRFDELGRKTQITIQDSVNTYTTNYSYDTFGRLNKLTNGTGSLIT